MTDRINAITVVLAQDIRDDDIQPTLSAMRQLRGVLSVTPNVSDFDAHIAEERALSVLREKMRDIIFPVFK